MPKLKILMCGSKLSVKGGMVTVIKNYLHYDKWDNIEIKYIPTHIEKNKLTVAFFFFFAYIRIIAAAIFNKYDIAYFHTAERGSFFRKAILLRTLKYMGVKTIMHHHAAEFSEFYNALSKNKKNYVSKTLEMADLNLVLSNRLIGMITDKAPKAKVKVLYNAVPTNAYNPYNIEAKGILFLGRLGERKGIYDLIKAITDMDSQLPSDIRFYLCGDGDVEKVERILITNHIAHRIAYIGWITESERQDILKNIMINVLPSYNEGLPMSILETMAYGIPNISTNIASIPEVINDGNNGYLIEPGDVTLLKKYIITLVENRELRTRLSEQSWYDISTKFSFESHIKKLKRYIYELR